MKVICAVIALILACVFVSQTFAKEQPTDCLPKSDIKCLNSRNLATIDGVEMCCPDSSSMSVSSSNINGNVTQSCKCGVKVTMPKMPEMPKMPWQNGFNLHQPWGFK